MEGEVDKEAAFAELSQTLEKLLAQLKPQAKDSEGNSWQCLLYYPGQFYQLELPTAFHNVGRAVNGRCLEVKRFPMYTYFCVVMYRSPIPNQQPRCMESFL